MIIDGKEFVGESLFPEVAGQIVSETGNVATASHFEFTSAPRIVVRWAEVRDEAQTMVEGQVGDA